ncbi:polysaccharide deacetylase family protein [Vibrio aphrogenes]|uniref:polysaccharide deacetylase family protein n=1 Tax=Vibrio aphrogenes TaxID=1891186 RepID=UPI000B34E7B5|nr:polysaccharide deacetylase family protein [Vibrio aphrogenes]
MKRAFYWALLCPLILANITTLRAANVAPSQQPPAGIPLNDVPQFIAIAFDDNHLVDGQRWVLQQWGRRTNPLGHGQKQTYDGQPIHTTFFNHCEGILKNNELATHTGHVKETWYRAHLFGHEMANHTLNHFNGVTFSAEQWQQQIGECQQLMSQPFTQTDPEFPNDQQGIDAQALGFRAPYLAYSEAMFSALKKLGIRYDASITEGYDPAHHAGNSFWPYTLDNGSPGAELMTSQGRQPPISHNAGSYSAGFHYAGLWEIPVYTLLIPDDETSQQYGIHYSLRDKIASNFNAFDRHNPKIESSDHHLFYIAKLSGPEVLAILKYNVEQRLLGNKAPLTFLAHSDYYDDQFDLWHPTHTTAAQRRQTLEAFLDYVLSAPQNRVVSHIELLKWLENPQPLNPSLELP